MNVSTDFGRVFDATADFLFIGGMFFSFVIRGTYQIWVFMLVIFMFVQFAVTSYLFRVAHDPIGKYYGSLLYGAIGLTILFPKPPTTNIIATIFLLITMISF